MRRDGEMDAVMKLNVLYEDNHLLVVEKPVNVPVQADASGDEDLLSMVRAYIREAYHKPGDAFAALVHRLDRPVGGVMVFARTSKAAARLTEQFRAGRARKRYAAVVVGSPEPEAALTNYLLKDENTHSSAVVPAGTPGSKEAKLRYALLARGKGGSLIDVELFTGRPHQIRVQMAHAGCPILSDQRYNPQAKPGDQIALWSYALTISHPTLGEEMTFFSAPRGEAFNAFPAQISMLPAFSVCRGVYEDDDVLVVDKNAGTEVETGLLPELESLRPGLRPVHRLDANTKGIVLFAKNGQAEERLLSAFRDHEGIRKEYEAVLCGTPSPASGRLVDYGCKDAERALMRSVPEGTKGALRMELAYRVLESRGGLCLTAVELMTGRTHQIRVQFAHAGHPVLGDDRYGDREMNRRYRAREQQLLAKSLTVFGRTFTSCRTLRLAREGGSA